MISMVNGVKRYFDSNGIEITEGCEIRYASGRVEKVYRTEEGELGVDATNPRWIELGRAEPCEYGIYPLNDSDLNGAKLFSLSHERMQNGEVLRELAGDMVVCYEAGLPGMMRLYLNGCFGPKPEDNRSTLMLVPMDMASEDIDMLSDMWLTEQEKEMGLPVGESCSSSSWHAGFRDDSKDNEITYKYDRLVECCCSSRSDKVVNDLIANAIDRIAKVSHQEKELDSGLSR